MVLSPANRSMPGISGMRGTERHPVAMIRNAAEAVAVIPSHRPAPAEASNAAAERACEPDVATEVEAIGDVLEVPQDLRLGGVALRPGPLLPARGPGVGVRHALDIAARAGVAVPEPGPADAGRLVDDANLTFSRRGGLAGAGERQSRTDHQRVESKRSSMYMLVRDIGRPCDGTRHVPTVRCIVQRTWFLAPSTERSGSATACGRPVVEVSECFLVCAAAAALPYQQPRLTPP